MSSKLRPKIEEAEVAPVPRTLWNRLLTLGPGLITGAADDDPSGISTYSVAGATTGLSMLWLALVTTPMMAVIQGMCARIAMVTGVGLAANMRRSMPNWLAYTIAATVVAANTFNIGADFDGMASAANMIVPMVPTLVWDVVFAVGLLTGLMVLTYRQIASVLKYMTISLAAYIVTAIIIQPPWGSVIEHLVVPHIMFSKTWITTAMGVLGTTITPYLFFWQSALEVEEEKALGRKSVAARKGATDDEIRDAHFDVNAGMILSNLVMFFIIVTTAFTLFAHGKTHIDSAKDAAEALRPLAGNSAYLLFTLGIVGTGLLAIPTLAGSSAYVAAEMLSFRRASLDLPPPRAPRFYAVLGAGLVAGMLMPFLKLNPITALYWAAVFNGVVSVPLLLVIIRIANDKKCMGKWRNSLAANIWSWLTFVLMATAAIGLFALP